MFAMADAPSYNDLDFRHTTRLKETNIPNKRNRLINPTWRESDQRLFASGTEEFKKSLPRSNSSLVIKAGLEPAIPSPAP